MKPGRKYYAKVLLFGEYGVIYGSHGLTVPLPRYWGHFEFGDTREQQQVMESNTNLASFLRHLEQISSENELVGEIRLQDLAADIGKGLFFNSGIPEGYGVGSSGALCAAVFDRYAPKTVAEGEQLSAPQMIRLREAFARMESYFHGISSGLDPLTSYLNRPLQILDKETIVPATIKANRGISTFFIDSGSTGKTGPLVSLFFDRLRQHSFYKQFNRDFLTAGKRCMDHYLDGDAGKFFEQASRLSAQTLDLFEPMIPAGFLDVWKKGLKTGDYALKLCGSGGGGFILGFCQNPGQTLASLRNDGFDIVSWE